MEVSEPTCIGIDGDMDLALYGLHYPLCIEVLLQNHYGNIANACHTNESKQWTLCHDQS